MLSQLAASGDDFVNAFNVFLTYPFVDDVVGRDPQVARNLHMGDYTNLSITLDLDLTQSTLPTNPTDVLPTELDPGQVLDNVLACIASGNCDCSFAYAGAPQNTRLPGNGNRQSLS